MHYFLKLIFCDNFAIKGAQRFRIFPHSSFVKIKYIGILGIQDIQGIHCFHGFQAFAILSDPKLPLNNIFLCGLAANNTTCVCVYKYFERLPHNAPDDRNPITLKYKTTDKIVLWAKISCSSCDPALSVHDNVNHHQDNTRGQHVNTSLDHG